MTVYTKRRIRLFVTYTILVSVVLVIAYPLVWTIGASFNPGNSLMSTSMIPENPTLAHYIRLLGEGSHPYVQWYLQLTKN